MILISREVDGNLALGGSWTLEGYEEMHFVYERYMPGNG